MLYQWHTRNTKIMSGDREKHESQRRDKIPNVSPPDTFAGFSTCREDSLRNYTEKPAQELGAKLAGGKLLHAERTEGREEGIHVAPMTRKTEWKVEAATTWQKTRGRGEEWRSRREDFKDVSGLRVKSFMPCLKPMLYAMPHASEPL